MASDFEGSVNIDQMDDDDVSELIRQRLDEDPDFDVDSVDVTVQDGRIVVEGRVGTDGERQHVEQVVGQLASSEYENNVVVDSNARAQRADAADEAHAEDQAARAMLGESGKTTTDTADHLEQDDAGDMYGTRSMKEAIEEGKSYTPPEGPAQQGIQGGEQH